MNNGIKVAIVHDYLNQAGGAERVVGVFRKLFPDAPIYTSIVDENKLLPELKDAVIHTTFMQKIPGIMKRFKLFFWLYPFAFRTIDLTEYNFVLSSSSAYAKGVKKGKGSVHLCYCHTPMRFAWDFEGYMEGVNVPDFVKKTAKLLTYPLRSWDKKNSKNVDQLIANSTVVKERIRTIYNLDVPIIYPPVNVDRFSIANDPPEDYFLIVSRLVSYKKIDIAVEACTRTNKRLIIIGEGPDRKRLEGLAGNSIEFLGRRSDEEVTYYMQRCQALLFPGVEDFGITPLEANACGRPVIAYYEGGALDTIKEGLNGLFFKEQNANSLANVLSSFNERNWDSNSVRKHAETFNEQIFMKNLESNIKTLIDKIEINTKTISMGVEA
ncbi:glycosyltransferase involved in cell wall biosynthesis [Paenibacillus phyllosphaerae]|uniref:Glycosyltransferase involved in cell wall biosynthesis n=1 Tax=Paenibacillus phyllosphaerae TaxID=274593 RepID=A0A7W5AU19_9BACL|nr:glycosyltransferase [Paenibacillus phyllosphaerae]MBB3108564.1 glycosyltransferase involved in cell wall biosynthesis [Paenibacillus phyllosphaerae]